jgi:hypothetical protein
MSDSIDRRWLVEKRSDIQRRILGVAFSLWRAVFLIRVDRTATGEVDHGRALLDILIRTNAVAFPQDEKTAHWMAGYYMNNALMRLREIAETRVLAGLFSAMTVALCRYPNRDVRLALDLSDRNLVGRWEAALAAFDAVF